MCVSHSYSCYIFRITSLKAGIDMMEISDVTGRRFNSEEAVYFRNLIQASFYIANGATILDVFTDSAGKMVVVFPRDEHKVLLKKWMENKENKENTDE